MMVWGVFRCLLRFRPTGEGPAERSTWSSHRCPAPLPVATTTPRCSSSCSAQLADDGSPLCSSSPSRSCQGAWLASCCRICAPLRAIVPAQSQKSVDEGGGCYSITVPSTCRLSFIFMSSSVQLEFLHTKIL